MTQASPGRVLKRYKVVTLSGSFNAALRDARKSPGGCPVRFEPQESYTKPTFKQTRRTYVPYAYYIVHLLQSVRQRMNLGPS